MTGRATIFERMMAKASDGPRWRVEQLVTSRLGTLAWLPVGEPFASRSLAEVAAQRLRNSQGLKALPTRVAEVQP